MFELRGLSDACDTNPNDPVCQAFYGTSSGAATGGAAGIAGRLLKLPSALLNTIQTATPQTPLVPLPGATQTTTNPGTTVTTIEPTSFPVRLWNDTPWWLRWGLIAAIGYGLWRYSRPSKPAAAAPSPLAGLFGVKRRRRR